MDLSSSVQYVKGVGPFIAGLLNKRNITTVSDLIHHIPMRYIDRRQISTVSGLSPGKNKTVIGEVVASGVTWIGRRRKRIYEIIIKDESGAISGKWFNFYEKYMTERFKKGSIVLLSGEASAYNNRVQFIHPDIELLDSDDDGEFELGGKILPIYPSTEGLNQKQLRKILKSAWDICAGELITGTPDELRKKYNLLDVKEALGNLHFPPNEADLGLLNSRNSEAHRTLIFEEFFVLELALKAKNAGNKAEEGIAFCWRRDLYEKFCSVLGFELTGAQKRVIEEIKNDMTVAHPMNRLIQGDVGSGKTVVAIAAAIQAIESGYQAAIMAPTEILAEQHFKTASKFLEKMNVPSALMTSSVKGEIREKIYEGVKSGYIKLVFGTHALIQDEFNFSKLGLIVIDEQHRFGVMQRAALRQKGAVPDVLIMTATPIPRTLAMTVYGDLDISVIDEMPVGRLPIITKLYRENHRKKLYDGMRIELGKGHQIYVVYPLIEESEKVDLKNATEMCEVLRSIFEPKYKVALLHGRMKGEEKENIMGDFKSGRISILAATSVVEVGVDVPNAAVMIIEHAERFGLSQLHQLRGRVGRSNIQSYCILMADWRSSDDAKKRLKIMQETNDGFRIAEEDLAIRGPGEFLGTRQSGLPEFHVADIIHDHKILDLARSEAEKIDLENDTKLKNIVLNRWGKKLELTLV